MLDGSKKPKPSGDFLGRDLGEEYLFYDGPGDRVHVLNGTARQIYLLCDGTRSVDDVADAISQSYDTDHPQAEQDTQRTVSELIDLGLLQL